jgi:hypothetical protein
VHLAYLKNDIVEVDLVPLIKQLEACGWKWKECRGETDILCWRHRLIYMAVELAKSSGKAVGYEASCVNLDRGSILVFEKEEGRK